MRVGKSFLKRKRFRSMQPTGSIQTNVHSTSPLGPACIWHFKHDEIVLVLPLVIRPADSPSTQNRPVILYTKYAITHHLAFLSPPNDAPPPASPRVDAEEDSTGAAGNEVDDEMDGVDAAAGAALCAPLEWWEVAASSIE